ncbi:protein PAXX isoform X1 [Eumetopias jubatus]|uniref:protein PAXX isoform X1 n=1 Tax=Eumetopias jubatus TaxID=34886 RepID=UPI0010168EDD|nr:protein PAXX isoform X1 [Eumetopias jubatus]
MVPPPPLSPPLCTLPPGPGPPRFVCFCEGEGSEDGGPGDINLYVTDAAELWSTCFTADSLAALKARFGLSAAEEITPRFRAACEQRAVTFTLQEDRASLTLSGGTSALHFDLSKVPGPEAAPRLQALTLSLAYQVCTLKSQLAGGVGRACPESSLGPPCSCLHSCLSSPAVEVTAASPRKSPCLVGPQLFLPGKACHLALWLGLCNSFSPEPDSNSRERMHVERGLWPWICTRLGNPPPVPFPSDPDPQRGGPGLGVRRRCPGESLINPGFKRYSPTYPPVPPSCAQGQALDRCPPPPPPLHNTTVSLSFLS